MKEEIRQIFEESIEAKKECLNKHTDEMVTAVEWTTAVFKKGGKLILFGNGGSAADAQHLAAEFVGRFKLERKALPAIALSTNTSSLTSIANDYSYDLVFARQVEAFAKKEDVVVGISTSGNAKSVIAGVEKAKSMGIKTIGLAGGDGGELAALADLAIIVPSRNTARVQEVHILIGHTICEMVEKELQE